MKGYLKFFDGYYYFTSLHAVPKINSFVIQGQVNRVYFYTDDRIDTEEWFKDNYFSRKYKKDRYTRPITKTTDMRLGLPILSKEELKQLKNELD